MLYDYIEYNKNDLKTFDNMFNNIYNEIKENIIIKDNKKLIEYKLYYSIIKKHYNKFKEYLLKKENITIYNIRYINNRLYYEIDYKIFSFIIDNKIILYKDNFKTLYSF